jgi:serine/threonine protein phosphatase 1
VSGIPASLPDGLRIYAVGDVHGRFDLLQAMHDEIRRDLERARPRESIEILLGDYVDRGPQSREVVEWVAAGAPAADRRICLCGNHEELLLAALADAAEMPNWLHNGGLDTLLSYAPGARSTLLDMTWATAHEEFLRAFPEEHRAFLEALPRMAEFGGYVFVHAGLRPGRPIGEQDPFDLVWIREPFLSSRFDFGRVVVHGHTPQTAPDIRPNRINIDTGAFFSGRLTCLVLEGDTRRFLQTSQFELGSGV